MLQAWALGVVHYYMEPITASWTNPEWVYARYLLCSVCVSVWIIVCSYNLKLSVFTKTQPSKRNWNSNYTCRIQKASPRQRLMPNQRFELWFFDPRSNVLSVTLIGQKVTIQRMTKNWLFGTGYLLLPWARLAETLRLYSFRFALLKWRIIRCCL